MLIHTQSFVTDSSVLIVDIVCMEFVIRILVSNRLTLTFPKLCSCQRLKTDWISTQTLKYSLNSETNTSEFNSYPSFLDTIYSLTEHNHCMYNYDI